MRRTGPGFVFGMRMAVTAVLTPLAVVGALVAAVVLSPSWQLRVALCGALIIGVGAALEQARKATSDRELTPQEAPDLHAAVERLCVLGDVPKPRLLLAAGERQPNSWVTDLPGRAPRLHVTQGLLDLLTPRELEAVLAHELAHVAHRDASVMTVVGLPGAALLRGGREVMGTFSFLSLGGVVAWLIGGLGSLGSSSLGRHRELAADALAARLTGHPAALSSALLKVSGEIGRLPAKDLRAAESPNAFNLVPVHAAARDGWRGRVATARPVVALTATHPSLRRRLAALERLEREQRRLSA